MDWSSLVIGLVSGLAGGFLGASAGVLAVLLQSETDIEPEIRSANRENRRRRAVLFEEFLAEAERYHSSTFVRRQLASMRPQVQPIARAIGVTDPQLDAFEVDLATQQAPLPDWIQLSARFWGPVLGLEDQELGNHLVMLLQDMCSPKDELGQGSLRPDQRTMLLWRSRLHLERYVSVVPVRRLSILQRLRRAMGVGVPEWEHVRGFDSEAIDRLRREIASQPAPIPRENDRGPPPETSKA